MLVQPLDNDNYRYKLCHKETCLRWFAIRLDSNRSARPQRLAMDIKYAGIIPYRYRITQTLIGLRGCAGGYLHLCFSHILHKQVLSWCGSYFTVLILIFWTLRSGHTVYTQRRVLHLDLCTVCHSVCIVCTHFVRQNHFVQRTTCIKRQKWPL